MFRKVSGSIGLYFLFNARACSSFADWHSSFTYASMPYDILSEMDPKYFCGWYRDRSGSELLSRASLVPITLLSFFSYFAARRLFFLCSATVLESTLLMISYPEEIKLLKFCSRNSNLSRYLVLRTSIPSSPYTNCTTDPSLSLTVMS